MSPWRVIIEAQVNSFVPSILPMKQYMVYAFILLVLIVLLKKLYYLSSDPIAENCSTIQKRTMIKGSLVMGNLGRTQLLRRAFCPIGMA